MSAYHELAQPAPVVDGAKATAPSKSDAVDVDPPKVSKEIRADPAPHSGPAVLYDEKKFAPKITPKEASALSVAVLRGRGTDFESEAGVIKGRVEKNFLRRTKPFSLLFDYRDCLTYGEVRRFIFIKGNCLFVYGAETDPYPLYAIQLETVKAMVENSEKPDPNSYTVCPQVKTNKTGHHLVTVLLKDKQTGVQAYQISFDTSQDSSVVKRFLDVLETNTRYYGGEVITASVVKAQNLAKNYSK